MFSELYTSIYHKNIKWFPIKIYRKKQIELIRIIYKWSFQRFFLFPKIIKIPIIKSIYYKYFEIIQKIIINWNICQHFVRIYTYIYIINRIQVGDKFSRHHSNKGILILLVSITEIPFLINGKKFDLLLNPLSIPSRINIRQIDETIWRILGFFWVKNICYLYLLYTFERV